MSLEQTKTFKEGYDKLAADYKAEKEKLKEAYDTEIADAKLEVGSLPTGVKKAVKEIKEAGHTYAQASIKAADKYVKDVEKLYKDSYTPQSSTKPIGTPEQPIAEPGGGTKPVEPEEPEAGQLPSDGTGEALPEPK